MIRNLSISLVLVAGLLLTLTKLYWVACHVQWIGEHGRQYRDRLISLRRSVRRRRVSATISDIHHILSTGVTGTGVRVGLFGFKEFRAWQYIEKCKRSSSRKMRLIGSALKLIIVATDGVPVLICGGLLVVIAAYTRAPRGQLAEVIEVEVIALSILLATLIIVLCIEAAVNYARMGAYATVHQDPLRFVNDVQFSRFISEASVLFGLGLAGLYIDTAMISSLAYFGVGIGTPQLAGLNPSRLFSSAYEATMTFLFSTQLSPSDSLGRAAVLLITTQGVSLLILTITAFSSTDR